MATILITGATSGLGRYLAFELARGGHVVLAHGRDEKRTEALVEELRAAGGRAEAYVADLAELAQVRDLGARVAADHPELDALVNNAGVGTGAPGSGRELSADGHELRFAVDLLAPVALTRALLPTLRDNAPSRVVNCGSLGQAPIDFDDLELSTRYSGTEAYCRAKFGLAAHTFSLARQLTGTGVHVNVIHPATYMDTAMVREAEVGPLNTVEDGASGVLALAVGELGGEATAGFFDGEQPTLAHADTYDREIQDRLDAELDRILGK
ncbi:SDR family NAD(P)-dependent oxidoreductase [Streptomyces sp. SDT5-1]|uniref:SDR family NAD(P)-dependent oxidoreductase n=1 Tax=Streptomyces sp. SDT5-1 TaxID=3406418 RepID=UPI003FD2E290